MVLLLLLLGSRRGGGGWFHSHLPRHNEPIALDNQTVSQPTRCYSYSVCHKVIHSFVSAPANRTNLPDYGAAPELPSAASLFSFRVLVECPCDIGTISPTSTACFVPCDAIACSRDTIRFALQEPDRTGRN